MSDVSREELMRIGQEVADSGGVVWFKFTCGACGARCAFSEPFTLYASGKCVSCGHVTRVLAGGMIVAFARTEAHRQALIDVTEQAGTGESRE